MHKFFSHIRAYLRWYVLLLLVISIVILALVISREDRQGILTFVMLDVGQGDALFIESPTGTQVLVDGGPNNNLMKEISHVLPWYDRHVDILIVTNPDRDHYEGFIPFLDKYNTDLVLEPGTTNPNPAYKVLEDKIAIKNIQKIIVSRGERIDLGGGAYLEILFPDRDISGLSPNDGSIVMRLVYGETSVLLQGDSTARMEEYLAVLEGEALKSTILKVGHHGSRTSTSEKYVTAVKPLWAIISSGKDNSYGHPHKETLDTLNRLKVLTYDTCNNGDIVFKSDRKNFVLKNKNPKPTEVGCKE